MRKAALTLAVFALCAPVFLYGGTDRAVLAELFTATW